MKALLVGLLVLMPTVASAQAMKPSGDVAGVVQASADEAVPPSSALSDLDKAEQTVLDLRVQLETALATLAQCQGEAGQMRAKLASQQLTADEQALKDRIEGRHAGFTYDRTTRTLTPKPPETK